MKELLPEIKYAADGLVPAIVQDAETNEVLMLAYMNAESLRMTVETGKTVFWSRSRSALWRKGATSGNTQRVVEIRVDCDADTLLVKVQPAGPACHTGNRTCFYRAIGRPF
ncbi:MAG: phosphoribosyl-AMP cyclohydrolase [Chloroflexota bacterium]